MCPIGWFRRRFSVVTRLRRAEPSAGLRISGMFPSAGSQRRDRWVSSVPRARTIARQRMKSAIRTFNVYNRQDLDRWRPGQVTSCSGGRDMTCPRVPCSGPAIAPGSANAPSCSMSTRDAGSPPDPGSRLRFIPFATFIRTVVIRSHLPAAMKVAICTSDYPIATFIGLLRVGRVSRVG